MAKVLITGTNRGIGAVTAIAVARAGHTVYATMRDPARGRALAEIAQRERLPISIVRMDVDIDESVDAATSTIRAEAGCIEYGPVIDAANSPAKYGDDTFVVVEKWESPEHLRAHAASPHMAAYGAKTREMIDSRVIHIMQPT